MQALWEPLMQVCIIKVMCGKLDVGREEAIQSRKKISPIYLFIHAKKHLTL